MDFLQLIKNGERITLDIPTYAATFAIPASILALLIATPNIPGIVKQTLAIPLLIANTLYPLLFTSHPSKWPPVVNLDSIFLYLTLAWV